MKHPGMANVRSRGCMRIVSGHLACFVVTGSMPGRVLVSSFRCGWISLIEPDG